MTREVIHEARIYCDGCGYAVVESTVGYIDRAFEQCGWLHATTPHGAEIDYCPVCRADSPFEAVQRVRDTVTERQREVSDMDPAFRMTVLIDVLAVLCALDGGSDE